MNKDWKQPTSWRSVDRKVNNVFFDEKSKENGNNISSNQVDKFLEF